MTRSRYAGRRGVLPRRWRRAAVVAAAAAIALGIVGMHGLTLHCANTASVMSAAGMTGMTGLTGMEAGPDAHEHAHSSASMHPTETAARTTADTPTLSGGSTASDPGPSEGDGMCDMVMLCVAMLAAAASALLKLPQLRRTHQSFRAIARDPLRSVMAGLMPSRTGNGPPVVWAFSVIRC